MKLKPLPFTFSELPSGKVFLSNVAGLHSVVPSINDIEDIVESKLESSSHLGLEMRSALIAVPQDDYEVSIGLLYSTFANRVARNLETPAYIMIVPTLRCDHSCTYCQVSRVSENKKGFDFDEENIDDFIRIAQNLGDGRPIKIEFQGGEPLLRFDIIKRVVEGLCLQRRSEKDDEYVIASSLSLLTEEMLEWAVKYPVFFSVSYDGPKNIHEIYRRRPSNDSWDRAVKGISRIQKAIGLDRVATVTTVTESALSGAKEIISGHAELGLKSMFVRPLSPYGFASYGLIKTYSLDEYFSFYQELILCLADTNPELSEQSAVIRLKKIFGVDNGSYVDLRSPAGYVLGALVIDYNGYIYGSDEARMLYRTQGIEELRLGHITDQCFDFSESIGAYGAIEQSFLSESPGCDECAYQSFCGADPIGNLQSQRDVLGNKSTSYHCQFETKMYELLVDLYYSNGDVQEMFLNWMK